MTHRRKRAGAALAASAMLSLGLFGCAMTPTEATAAAATSTAAATQASAAAETQKPAAHGGAGQSTGTAAAPAAAPEKTEFKNKDLTDIWDASAAKIQLNGSSAACDAAGVTIDGSNVTITTGGSYVLAGTLDNGRIIVDAADTDDVQLVLNGVSITNADGPAIHAKDADKTILTVAGGTQNTVSDGAVYVDTSEDAPNASIYAACDLSINGTGALSVTGNFNNGIGTKDDLKIANGNLTVKAANNALKGKDSVSVLDGTFTLEAGGDAIQSDKQNDPEKGWVVIDGGSFTITAANDAVQAETGMTINGGTFDLTTNGGAENGEQKPGGGFGGNGGSWFQSEDGTTPQRPSDDGTGSAGSTGFHKKPGKRGAAVEDGTSAESAASDTTPVSLVLTAADAASTDDAAESAETESASPEQAEGRRRRPQTDASSRPAGDTQDPAQSGDAVQDSTAKPSRPSGAATDGSSKPSRPDSAASSGSQSSSSSDSWKGLKSSGTLTVNGGTFQLNCADDAVHSNSDVLLNGGTFTISTGDDGVHADGNLRINADVNIEKSNEGLEGANVYIESGNINITSSDDSVNAAGSSGRGSGMSGQGQSQNNVISVSGGTVNAVGGGDGFDSNGSIEISGGDVTMLIKSSADNCAIDAERSFTATGGNIIYGGTGTGSGPANGSTQSYVFAQGSFAAGTEVSLRSGGQTLISFTPSIDCSSLSFSLPGITSGTTYEVYAGDILVTSAEAGKGSSGMAGGGMGGFHGGMSAPDGADFGQDGRPQRPDMGSADGTMPDGAEFGQDGRPQRPDMGSADGTMPDGAEFGQDGRPQRPGTSTADGAAPDAVTSPSVTG